MGDVYEADYHKDNKFSARARLRRLNLLALPIKRVIFLIADYRLNYYVTV